MDYLVVANSTVLWLSCIPPVLLVLWQAWVMGQKAWKTGLEMGLKKSQLQAAVRSAAISSFGPSTAILSGMMALIIMAGGPMAWLRLSYIGAVTYEAQSFNFGLIASGVTAQSITAQAYTNAIWCMLLGSLGWIIFAMFSVDKMDKVQGVISKGDPNMMRIVGGAAMVGGSGCLSASYLTTAVPPAAANLTAIFVMALILFFNAKWKIGWLRELSLTFCLIAGCVAAITTINMGL